MDPVDCNHEAPRFCLKPLSLEQTPDLNKAAVAQPRTYCCWKAADTIPMLYAQYRSWSYTVVPYMRVDLHGYIYLHLIEEVPGLEHRDA